MVKLRKTVPSGNQSPVPSEAPSPASSALPGAAPDGPLEKARVVRGTPFIIGLALVMAAVIGGNTWSAHNNDLKRKQRIVDTAAIFDKTQVAQTWTPTSEGMRFVATAAVPGDEITIQRIRRQLKFQRTEYLRANYSDIRFGNRDIAGRADLEYGTAHEALNCRYAEVDGGAQLEWIAANGDLPDAEQKPIMIDALAQWSAALLKGPPPAEGNK
jgi:hypothetical protein